MQRQRGRSLLRATALASVLLAVAPAVVSVPSHADEPACQAPPPAPTDLRVVAEGSDIRFSWSPSDAATSYTVDTWGFSPTNRQELSSIVTTDSSVLQPFAPEWNGLSFYLNARNACGQSGWPLINSPSRPPIPLVETRAFGSGRDIEVLWTLDPRDNGSQFEERIRATAQPGGKHCEGFPQMRGCTITGLSLGRRYTISVASVNQLATVPAPRELRPILLVTGPTAPQALGVAPTVGAARVTWRPPKSDGGRTITRYVVTSVPEGHSCATRLLSCTVPGLSGGRQYRFVVVADNGRARGKPAISSPVTAVPVPSTDAPTPSGPTDVPKPTAPIS